MRTKHSRHQIAKARHATFFVVPSAVMAAVSSSARATKRTTQNTTNKTTKPTHKRPPMLQFENYFVSL